jgi:hypothetical protein
VEKRVVNLENLRVFAKVVSTAISNAYDGRVMAAYESGASFSTRTKKQKHEVANSIAKIVLIGSVDASEYAKNLVFRLSWLFINSLPASKKHSTDTAVKAVEDRVIRLILNE